MSTRDLVIIPDPILRTVSKPVERIDDTLNKLLDDMLDTMYEAPGIGLAGIQIAVPLRIVVLDVAEREMREQVKKSGGALSDLKADKQPLCLINPEIVALADEPSVFEEGCLSIPDYFAQVERPAGCTVTYLDREGKQHTMEAEGVLSTVIQHEVDHLNGKLFIDYLSTLKRNMVVRKFTKYARQAKVKPAKAIYA